jgi:hypothetical protein
MVLLPITDPWNVMINNRVIKIIITVLNTAGHLRDSGENIKMYVTDIHMYISKI